MMLVMLQFGQCRLAKAKSTVMLLTGAGFWQLIGVAKEVQLEVGCLGSIGLDEGGEEAEFM